MRRYLNPDYDLIVFVSLIVALSFVALAHLALFPLSLQSLDIYDPFNDYLCPTVF